MRCFALPLVAAGLVAGSADAQHHTPAPAFHDWAYYNLKDGPSIQVFAGMPRPHAAGGFYATGVSRHGPTIPVYAPAPAVVVDPTRHHSGFSKKGFGLGWFGTRTPSPRPKPTTVSVYP